MILSNKMQTKKLIETITKNHERTKEGVKKILTKMDAKEALAALKFDKTVLDEAYEKIKKEGKGGVVGPFYNELIKHEENKKLLKYIEMLNQAYSDFVVLKTVEDLMDRYPDKAFELHMGALTGFDIVSTDKEVVAECFATVTAFNNQKIKKDSEKLMQLEEKVEKYIYFYSREDTDEKLRVFYKKYPQITYSRIKEL